MLLLQHNADVSIINGEGRLPREMTQSSSDVGREIAKLLRAAEQTGLVDVYAIFSVEIKTMSHVRGIRFSNYHYHL